MKETNRDKDKKWESLPNEFHRKARWSRGLIVKSKKTYSRKRKHKKGWG